MTKIRRQAVNLLEGLHLRVFGETISDEMRKFILHLGWISAAALVSAVFMFITNLFAGRWLGPAEYGKYALIISLGQLFIIPMTLGINTAAIREIAQKKSNRAKVISTAFYSILFLILLSLLLYWLLRPFLEQYLHLTSFLYLWAIIYSMALALKYISEAVAKGLHQFPRISVLTVLSSLVILIVFFGQIFIGKDTSFRSFILATTAGLAIYVIVMFFRNRLYFFRFSVRNLRELLSYGLFASIGSISGYTLANIDRLILNNYLGFASVGLYAAYLSASTFFSGQLLQIFVDVFFPSISAIKDKSIVERKIKRILYLAAIPLFGINLLATAIIIKLFGSEYEFNYLYIILFSLLGVLNFCQNIFWWYIASFGKRGIRFTSLSGVLVGAANIILMIILVKKMGLLGAIIGLNITSLAILLLSVIYLRKKKWQD